MGNQGIGILVENAFRTQGDKAALGLGWAPKDRNVEVNECGNRAERRYNLLDVTGIMAEELVTSLRLGKPERDQELRRQSMLMRDRRAAKQANRGTGAWRKFKAAGHRIVRLREDWQRIACMVSRLSELNQGIVTGPWSKKLPP